MSRLGIALIFSAVHSDGPIAATFAKSASAASCCVAEVDSFTTVGVPSAVAFSAGGASCPKTFPARDENITAENFPYEELTWEKIAALPKAERRGGGIPKETWEEFIKDYIAVMPGLTGKTLDKVENAARNFANKFAAVKTNKKVLGLLVDQLGIYTTSPNAENFLECINFLTEKADKLMNMSEEELLANL